MTLRLRWDQLYIDREGISQILRDDSSKKKKIRKECVAQIVTDELSVLEFSQPPHSPDLVPTNFSLFREIKTAIKRLQGIEKNLTTE